ncbi:MAG: glycosyltransferase [Bacteroidales bacterium]|jgi:glycosyltransferase involved in cell wall biosynthesis
MTENIPDITVLMPVYNCEKYIKESVESILNQTFVNFEFLIINDASTDNTRNIISSYNDKRIILIDNNENIGLSKSLNKGIEIAKGKYIARMDADDISLPTRLEKQFYFLNNNIEYCLVAAKIIGINEKSKETSMWDNDNNNITYRDIYYFLPKANCIAHPTVLIRKEILIEYKYSEKPYFSQDWDLWLRLISDKKKIAKLDEVLLKYRVHNSSVSNFSENKNKGKKSIILRYNFLKNQFYKLKINTIFLKVSFFLLIEIKIFYLNKIKSIFKHAYNYFYSIIEYKIIKKIYY